MPGGKSRVWIGAAGVVGGVLLLGYVTSGLLDGDTARRLLATGEGDYAAPGFVVVAAVLCCAFVPTPLLASGAGAIFGVWVGTGLAVASFAIAALGQLLPLRLGFGGRFVASRASPIMRLKGLLRDNSWQAVVALRLIPGVPFALSNYALGLTTLQWQHVALGTAIGSAPRAAIYAGFGDAVTHLNGSRLIIALSLLALVGAAGLAFSTVLWRRTKDKPVNLLGVARDEGVGRSSNRSLD